MFDDFSKWIDSQIKDGISDGEGLCFNLYEEEEENCWSVEMAVSEVYDPDDEDWACETIYNSEDIFVWDQNAEWDDVLEDMIQLVIKYLDEGKYSDMLKEKYKAIAVGFVDGDLELVYEQ